MDIVRFNEIKKTWHQIARNNDGSIAPNFELEVYKKMFNIFIPEISITIFSTQQMPKWNLSAKKSFLIFVTLHNLN